MSGCAAERACAVACRLGDESQQPTWPHSRQIRRCSHLPPVRRQSSQPATSAGRRVTSIESRWVQAAAIGGTLPPTYLLSSFFARPTVPMVEDRPGLPLSVRYGGGVVPQRLRRAFFVHPYVVAPGHGVEADDHAARARRPLLRRALQPLDVGEPLHAEGVELLGGQVD